ncbi:heavy-metal-associated domain-containing protein [Changchengzhania lutea]|uniref:heavy-metal-associated domain-containing protein n=1 Tax=Changchengzhania lutea TaxID=2049305 RepID=UPI00115D8BE6|nr:heavy metal-associated domain-containing protein [Changchengzhania lutea]
MKTLKNIIAIVIVTVFVMNCKNEVQPEVKTIAVEADVAAENKLDPNAKYAKAEFTIEGMTCAVGCAKTIEKKMSQMDGVKSATVDFDKKLAMVEYDEAKVNPVLLEETVTKVADIYKVTDMKTVADFSTAKSCDKRCCAGKTDAEKAACKEACCADKTSMDNKTACAADCKKACCAKKETA